MKTILLPALATDDLLWQGALALAEKEGALFWKIDLGLEHGALHLKDDALFASCALALEQFVKEIWPRFKEKTHGLLLYDGVYDISERLVWNATMEEHFSEFLEKCSSDTETRTIKRELFSADLFAQFLHRLLSILPEELEVKCQFDVTAFNNSALLTALFSRTRFEYLKFLLKGTTLPFEARDARVGLLIPTDQVLTPELLNRLEAELLRLQAEGPIFRFIPELLLAEEWDGLEELVVIPESLSVPGKRLLHGFTLAGGTTIER